MTYPSRVRVPKQGTGVRGRAYAAPEDGLRIPRAFSVRKENESSVEYIDMLNWICPDCGRECLPATRECPLCASSGATGVAQTDAQGASVAALSAAVSGGKTAGSSTHGSSVAVMEPPVPAEPEPQVALERDLLQVRDRVGERIARVQRLYAESAP